MPCGRYISGKMLKISVGSSSSCERSSLGGNLIFHQKKGEKRPKLSTEVRVFLCSTLIGACCGWKHSQSIVEAHRGVESVCQWRYRKAGVSFLQMIQGKKKKACFVFNQDDWQRLQSSLTNIVIWIFSSKVSVCSWWCKSLHFFLTGTEWYSWKWNRKLLILLVTTSKLSSTLGLLSRVCVLK